MQFFELTNKVLSEIIFMQYEFCSIDLDKMNNAKKIKKIHLVNMLFLGLKNAHSFVGDQLYGTGSMNFFQLQLAFLHFFIIFLVETND